MAWKIKCKMTHPRGFMRREGLTFPSRSETYVLELTPGLEKEKQKYEDEIGWLIFTEVSENEVPEPDLQQDASEDLELLRKPALRQLAHDMDLSLPGSLRKDELISAIRESGKPIPELTEY